MKNNVQNKWVQALFYILVFFLLREWLLPVLELTDTNYLSIFLAFIVLCLVMSFFSVPWWLSGPGKLIYIGWILIYIYTNEVFFTGEAISFLFNDFMTNTTALINRDWPAVTNSFRTVLFFTLLWMTAYLIHHWISVRMNIFLFFFMTVVFIAALDSFSPYLGDGAILRVMVLGLLLSGLLKVTKILKQNHLSVTSEKYGSLLIPLIVIVAISGSVGYFLPKANPVWDDPVPFLQSFAEGAGSGSGGSGGIQKIGYGEDDSILGGGFQSDSTVVFEATVKTGQYWKIETKDTYTSKGWEQSVSSNEIVNYDVGDMIDTGISPGLEEDQDVAQYTFKLQFPFIMYPYGSIAADAQEGTSFSVSTNTQKIETYQENEAVELNEYSVSFSEPTYSLTALRGTTEDSLAQLGTEFDRYLQLPEALPERVRELAQSITENETNLYDKAKAIERYFPKNSYIYDQRNVSVPTADQDYVDQFLFDTKRGYCDNFSTSMVVMLRSLDIPARWVKGFAEGEQMQNDEGERVYQVTNNNAHSWVEAYFPGVGWMPFEPTIGFSGAGNIDYDVELDTTEPPEEQVIPEQPSKPEKPDAVNNKSISERFTETIEKFVDWISDNRGRIILWSLIAIAIGFVLFRIRHKWMPKLLVPYYRLRKNDWHSFESSYHRLLKQLSLHGISRNEGQTLQSYAKYVDGFFGSKDMKTLTTAYEKGFYGKKIESQEWLELRESWENLINRTSG
ncbi:MAG TPA: transglutaminase domain-containing protein [Paenisporosarcina sp.]|nr:transglutaminase domain-containing protein [Paenisporosarcina sp.]